MRVAIFLQLDTEHGRGILRGIAQYFRRYPQIIVLKFGRLDQLSPTKLRQLNVDGIIARVATAQDESAVRLLKVPVVNVSGQRPTPGLPTVNTDDVTVGRMAARHLISRGYRQLAFCGTPEHLAGKRRLQGFAAEARERQLPTVQEISRARLGEEEPNEAERIAWREELARLPRPIGIFGFTDPVAVAIAEGCGPAGLRVPEDAAVLGVGNDLTRLGFAHVDLTSIQLNTFRIGELAAESLHLWLTEGKTPEKEVLLPPVKLVTRQSTDLLTVDDEAVALALEHIRAHAGNTVYVDDVARAAGVSRRVLELKFRAHLGTSVYAEVQRSHFEHAIELMSEPDLTIAEIAYTSGFDSAQRFSTAFRRRFGAPPAQYRAGLSKGQLAAP